MINRNWTDAQSSVISNPYDKNLLVSASAGSGKTSVMIEKIAQMLNNGVKWDEILVMTFTVESARDMKRKLDARLGKNWQLSVSQMSIGTFHKFCGELLQTYFSVVGVNPSYAIIDEGNAAILQDQVLDILIEENTLKYSLAIDAYCGMYGSGGLKDVIRNVAQFLEWQDDADEWIAKYAFAGYKDDLSQNSAMQSIIDYYNMAGQYFAQELAHNERCIKWAIKLCTVKTYEDLHNIAICFDSLGRMSSDDPGYNAKGMLNKILKDKIKKQYSLPINIIKQNQIADKKLIEQVIYLVQEYRIRYSKAKSERNFLDFSDLEKYTLQLLNGDKIRERVREKYKYIFVDEYQDTNPVQEKILSLLSGGVIFTVGDVKQSIYGFRGTSSVIFVNRMKEYLASKEDNVIYLNKNFRSNDGILRFVNSIFSNIMRENTSGLDYHRTSMFSVGDACANDSVEVIAIDGGEHKHQAMVIANRIMELFQDSVKLGDIAILARNGNHIQELVQILKSAGIKCITDKKQSVEELFEIELLNNMLLACSDLNYELPWFLLKESFLGEIDRLKYHELCKTMNVVDVLTTFIAQYDIINRLLVTQDGDARVENIYSFLNKLRSSSYSSTVAQYTYMLKQGLLDIQIDVSGVGDCVRVMTIHSSKGLEFPIVFLYGAGDKFSLADTRKKLLVDKQYGMCVYSTDEDENTKHYSIARLGSVIAANREQVAEEMRLLYVALTRAQDKLIIVGKSKTYVNGVIPKDFEILNARSYFDFIRPLHAISVDDIEFLENGKKQRLLSGTANKKLVVKFQQRFSFNYKFKSAIDMVQKSSVTSLTKIEQEFIDEKLVHSKYEKDRGTEYGTRFHMAMQNGVAFDDAGKKCLEIIGELTRGMKCYHELTVLENLEMDGENLLVQGVIDLLAVEKGRAILVDYKTNKASEERLTQLYRGQLIMYAEAVKKTIGIMPQQIFIYSTKLGKLIEIKKY